MEKLIYMVMLEKSMTYNRVTKKAITEHVENIRRRDDEGKLEICGVFKGYPGMAGIYILKTESREEAEEICRSEPLVMGKQLFAVTQHRFNAGRKVKIY